MEHCFTLLNTFKKETKTNKKIEIFKNSFSMVRVLSRNVAGLNRQSKLHQALSQARRFDVALFQEVKLRTAQVAFIRNKWGSDLVFLSSNNHDNPSRGSLILLSPRLNAKIMHSECDDGQFVILVVVIWNETFCIGSFYGSPGTDAESVIIMNDFANRLENIKTTYNISHFVIGGDWNFVLEVTDSSSERRKNRVEAACRAFLMDNQLLDIATLQDDQPLHTYFRHGNQNISSRLDRFYCDIHLVNRIKYKLLPRVGDHSPISLEIDGPPPPSLWRFSDTLLDDPKFRQGCSDVIDRVLREYSTADDRLPLSKLQDCIDYNMHAAHEVMASVLKSIREYAMQFSKKLAKRKQLKENQLIQDIIDKRDVAHVNQQQADIEALNQAKENYRLFMDRKHEAASLLNHKNYSLFADGGFGMGVTG